MSPKNNTPRLNCQLETSVMVCYTEYMNNTIVKNALLCLGAKENVLLSSLTTFHIGGPASFFIEADNADTIKAVYSICNESHFPLAVIGNGSNLICPDIGFDGLVLKVKKSNRLPIINANSFTAFAGDSLTQISNFIVKSGFSGFERLAGIPGSIGGAVSMNAGAYGSEIKDVLKRVHYICDGSDYWATVNPDEFGYRKSPFSWPSSVILEAVFTVATDNGQSVSVMDDCMRQRREKQPLEYPSAGSVFKRPAGYYAGKLIEDAGLKGFRIGGAEVSEKHAGFIINRGGATEKDVLTLIEYIQETVFSKFNVALEREVLRLGEIVCTF